MSGTNSFLIFNYPDLGAQGVDGSYFPIQGSTRTLATESYLETIMTTATTFSEQTVYWLHGVDGATTIKFRNNGSTGNQICTAAGTGTVTDSSHSDSVSASHTADYLYNTAGLYYINLLTIQTNSATPYTIQGAGYHGGSGGLAWATTTQYINLCGAFNDSVQTTSSLTTQQTLEAAGTASYFSVNINSAPGGTASLAFQIGGSPANEVISTTGSTGVVQDVTHNDSIARGNAVDLKFSATTNSGNFYRVTYSFAGMLSAQDLVASVPPRTSTNTSYYQAFGGFIENTGTTADSLTGIPYGATASLLRLTNDLSGSNAGTVASYINSGTGNQLVTYSGTAGIFVDTTHTDSISATNKLGAYVLTTLTTSGQNEIAIALDDGSADVSTGDGAIALNIAVAAVGTGINPSSASIGLVIVVAAVGLAIVAGAASIGLNIAVAGAATGLKPAAAAIGLNIDLEATPKYTFPSAASFGLNIALSGVGANIAINPGGGDVPLNVTDWKRKWARWKELEEEAIAAEEERRGKIRAGVVDAFERHVEGKTDPEPPPAQVPLPPMPRGRSREELMPLARQLSIRKHPPSNQQEKDDEEAILLL